MEFSREGFSETDKSPIFGETNFRQVNFRKNDTKKNDVKKGVLRKTENSRENCGNGIDLKLELKCGSGMPTPSRFTSLVATRILSEAGTKCGSTNYRRAFAALVKGWLGSSIIIIYVIYDSGLTVSIAKSIFLVELPSNQFFGRKR